MIPVSDEYKRQLIAGNRNWVIKIPVYLSDNTSMVTPDFTLTNENVWDQGVVIDQATSSDNSFDLGSAIVGSLKVVIDNINGNYSQYDFYNAKLVLWLGVEGDVDENEDQVYYRIGFYVVDEPSYNGSLITLNCLDNMTWFDLPFSEVTGVSFPTTAGVLVAAICSRVGVTLGTVSFPNYTTVIPVEPDAKLNCREVLQYVAQMCCCYCKIDRAGQLVLAWYDKTAITGLIDYDGGTFNNPEEEETVLQTGHNSGGFVQQFINYAYFGRAGTFTLHINISNVSYPPLEDTYSLYEKVGSGSYIQKETGSLSVGDNVIEYELEITETNDKIYYLEIGQHGSAFDWATSFFTPVYADGCDLEGGNFTDYSAGDVADGGTFADLNNGAYLSQNYQMEVSTDDIVVTGCRVRNSKTDEDEAYDELVVDSTLEQTHDRYVLVIEDNPFINTSNASAIATQVATVLAGLPIRAYTATSLADFSYETGDMARVYDFRGNVYYSWITKFTFTTNNSEQFGCGAESVRKRNEERYSGIAKTLAEAEDSAKKLLSDYDTAVKAMNELAQDAIGYYEYQHTVSGAMVTWLHNGATEVTTDPEHPTFPNSTVVFKISGDGVFISNDGGTTYTQGYDANSGTAILSLIYAVGINCDWIHAGTLTLGGNNDVNGVCSVLNASGVEKVRLDKSGLTVYAGKIQGPKILSDGGDNELTIDGGEIVSLAPSASHNSGYFRLYAGPSSGGGHSYELGFSAKLSHARKNSSSYYKEVDSYKIIEAADSASDIRLKTNIEELSFEEAWNYLTASKTYSFNFKENMPQLKRFGLIAQEFKAGLEEHGVDTENLWVLNKNECDGMYCIEYPELVPHLIKVVTTQQEQIDELKKELAELKAR